MLKHITLGAAVLALSCMPAYSEQASERLQEASLVVQELMGTADSGIPRELLERAHCAVVIPGSKKGGFFFGAHYGRGFAICRNDNGAWGAPAAVRMEGGSIGPQIGVAETDIFMLVMNERGMRRLLSNKFTLDAKAGVAAGPVGRAAEARTDAFASAGILAWSRSRGAFAGMTLGGGTLRNDLDENQELYGRRLTNRQILRGNMQAPASAQNLIATLNQFQRTQGTADRVQQ
jgi:SH3 domain-containing YSC84-like protein 1